MSARFLCASLAWFLVAVPSVGLGQPLEAPSYANLYWEASGHTWDSDVATYAGSQEDAGDPYYLQQASMTADGVDSMLRSALSSGWTLGWQTYGVVSVDPIPSDFTIIPDDHPTIPECIGVTPSSTNLVDWLNNAGGFISCALAVLQQQQATPSASTVLNIFIPPWVTLGPEDPCIDGGFSGLNFPSSGYSVAWLPTGFECEPYGLPELIDLLSHEDTEATMGGDGGGNAFRNVCDSCEGESLDFLHAPYNEPYGILATYDEYDGGITNECIPTSTPAMNPPGAYGACGSGQNMVIQMELDSSRNPTPWDIGETQEVSDGGSLYFATQTLATPSWMAGGEHVLGLPNPVIMQHLQWTSGGYVEMDGFGSGYGGTNIAPPGSQTSLYAFDPVWGQLNETLGGGTPFVMAEMPEFFSDVYAARPIGSQYQAWNVQGFVFGSPSCGLPGHTVGPAPIGDAQIAIQGASGDTYPRDAGTIGSGLFFFQYTPNSPGKKFISFTAPGGLEADAGIIVAPEIDAIIPNTGIAAGGQQVTITGRGLAATTLPIRFSYLLPDGGGGVKTVNASNTSDTSVTFTTPQSILPGSGIGTMQVVVENAGQFSDGYDFTYVVPGKPYLTFKPGGANCYPGDHAYITAVLYQPDGGYNPNAQITFAPVIAGAVTFTPAVVSNGGTTEAAISIGTDAPYEFTATSGPYTADAGVHPYPTADCKAVAGLSGTVLDGHVGVLTYSLSGSTWKTPMFGDPWDWAEPVVTHLSSPYSPSSFTIETLGQSGILGLNAFVSASGYWAAAIPYSSHSGSNLCFTGRVLSITDSNETPDWAATVLYPIDTSVPANAYRVFGLNQSNATWVEMESSIVAYGSGDAIEATDESVDPHSVISGAVNGPYALTYWSTAACPTQGP